MSVCFLDCENVVDAVLWKIQISDWTLKPLLLALRKMIHEDFDFCECLKANGDMVSVADSLAAQSSRGNTRTII